MVSLKTIILIWENTAHSGQQGTHFIYSRFLPWRGSRGGQLHGQKDWTHPPLTTGVDSTRTSVHLAPSVACWYPIKIPVAYQIINPGTIFFVLKSQEIAESFIFEGELTHANVGFRIRSLGAHRSSTSLDRSTKGTVQMV